MFSQSQRGPRAAGDGSRRAVVQLAVLIVVAAAMFFLTIALAREVRDRARADAAEWYDRGRRAAAAGEQADAVEAYRRAVGLNRDERTYGLELASALTRAGQPDAAERALQALRLDTPEDPAVNEALARLAAARGDTEAAVRYYRNALYASWPTEAGPRRVRSELIDYLIAEGDERRALAEILAATTGLPDTVDNHMQVARWFAATGEPSRALDYFRRALLLEPAHEEAIEGAGLAAFNMGDYAGSLRYLGRQAETDAAARARDVAALVLSEDPLAPRISTAARRRRLTRGLEHVAMQLETCAAAGAGELMADVDAMRGNVSRLRDLEAFADGVALLARSEMLLAGACGSGATVMDDALIRIARRYDLETP